MSASKTTPKNKSLKKPAKKVTKVKITKVKVAKATKAKVVKAKAKVKKVAKVTRAKTTSSKSVSKPKSKPTKAVAKAPKAPSKTAKAPVAKKTTAPKAKPAPEPKKAPAKTAPVKAAKPEKSSSAKKTTPVKTTPAATKATARSHKAETHKPETAEDRAKIEQIRQLTHKQKHTPAIFKLPSRKSTPVMFTLEDVREVLKHRKEEVAAKETPRATVPAAPVIQPTAPAAPQPRQRFIGAASLADILGFQPVAKKPSEGLTREVPKKWSHYYKLLVELRTHLRERLNIHVEESFSRSSRDDAGDLSGYSQHLADAGAESFDRDFALSLVSTEKEALAEVEAAIERIFAGTYGICEITVQNIAKERLEAVPFTRFSLEGQTIHEQNQRRNANIRANLFSDLTSDDSPGYADDSDE